MKTTQDAKWQKWETAKIQAGGIRKAIAKTAAYTAVFAFIVYIEAVIFFV